MEAVNLHCTEKQWPEKIDDILAKHDDKAGMY
jgi:hypothetical protein